MLSRPKCDSEEVGELVPAGAAASLNFSGSLYWAVSAHEETGTGARILGTEHNELLAELSQCYYIF